MGESEPGIEGAPSAGGWPRPLRAAAAGVVTFAVIVAGGLLLVTDHDPGPRLERPAASSSSRVRAPSSRAPGSGRPGPPTHLEIERGVTTVSLVWDRPGDAGPRDVDHYEIFRDGKRMGRSTRARYEAAGLTFGTRYRFWVVAVGEEARSSPRVLRSVTTKVPPLTAARLSGTYAVVASLSASDGDRVRFSSHSITWSLVPQCPGAACDVSFTATHGFGSGAVVTSGVLKWSGGASYVGKWIGVFGSSCRQRRLDAISTLTITMRATSAHAVGSLWVASDVAGSIHERVRGCGGAPDASYAF